MSELESINKINFSTENIPTIFENQRKSIKKDILFLKEDILKDFRQIETKLNTKYEKQNTSTLSKLHKFENIIETMNNKILELSNLISTDKNIQQKIANLYDFKLKVSDSLLTQQLAIKSNESIIKEVIDKYDKLFSESVLYPGVIGSNGRFKNFHNFIDYIITNMNEFTNFKEKNIIDYKSYKTKLEGLFKSLKMQADSITTSNNKYTNKRFNDLEKKMKELIDGEETKIFDLKVDNNKLGLALENKINQINKDIKYIKETKINISEKIEEEINLLKDFNKGVTIKFENCENEINTIKDKYNILYEIIQNVKYRIKKTEQNQKKDNNIISNNTQKLSSHNSISYINNNYNKFMRRETIAKSIIKQYINGEIGISEIESPSKRQKSTYFNENEIKNIMNSINNSKINNKNYSQDNNISKIKRMTYGPEKFMNLHKLDKNDINTYIDVNSEKSIYNKSNNSISEEKSEDIDYINSFKEQNENDNNIINKNNINEDKIESFLYKEVDKNNKINSLDKNNELIDKDKFKEGEKILLLDYKNKNEVNSEIQTDNMKKENNNIDIKKDNKNINYSNKENTKNQRKNSGGNLRTLSYQKENIESSNSFPKFTNNTIDIQKQYRMNNQKQMSAVSKLCNIGGNIDIINYSKTNLNRLNKTSIFFYDNNKININNNKTNRINNYKHYNNLKKRINKNKLNIIEVNFDEGNGLIKEKDEVQALIKKIKENRVNILSERNTRSLDKNKGYKKFHMSDIDLGVENKSMNGSPINNKLSNYFFYNKMIKDELQNYSSFGYINYMNNNKKLLNMRKMNLCKKNLYGNFID